MFVQLCIFLKKLPTVQKYVYTKCNVTSLSRQLHRSIPSGDADPIEMYCATFILPSVQKGIRKKKLLQTDQMAFWLLCDDAIDPYEFLDLRHHLSLYFFSNTTSSFLPCYILAGTNNRCSKCLFSFLLYLLLYFLLK